MKGRVKVKGITTWLKAKFSLTAIALIWGSLIVLMLPIMLVAYTHDKQTNRKTMDRWLYSVLIAQDILVNCILGGYFRTTISSEVGNLKKRGSQTGKEIANFIDWGFLVTVGQLNHCEVSIEKEDKHFVTPFKAMLGFTLYTASITALIIL